MKPSVPAAVTWAGESALVSRGFRGCFWQEHINIHDWHEKYSEGNRASPDGTELAWGGWREEGSWGGRNRKEKQTHHDVCAEKCLNHSCCGLAVSSITEALRTQWCTFQPKSMTIIQIKPEAIVHQPKICNGSLDALHLINVSVCISVHAIFISYRAWWHKI